MTHAIEPATSRNGGEDMCVHATRHMISISFQKLNIFTLIIKKKHKFQREKKKYKLKCGFNSDFSFFMR